MTAYDLVTVGGGIGGSALAKVMAESGYRALIVEREPRYRDRVRGEFMFPWGVADAQQLGLYDAFVRAGAHHPTYWTDFAGPDALPPRDFAEDTPQKVRGLCLYHPRLQEAALEAALAAGADVRRGARVLAVEPGAKPTIVVEDGGERITVSTRLAVGADGRASMMRKWGGFDVEEEPPGNIVAGVLVEGVSTSPESSICMLNPSMSRMALYFPQTSSSGRAYLASRSADGVRVHGEGGFDVFLRECAESGLADWVLDGARQAGPLATFEGAGSWVDHPHKNGVALVGDAAATNDPTWGQGLSCTLRDARLLRDALLADEDWDAAGDAYADAHDRCFEKVRTAESWFTQVFLEPGPRGDALREHVLPQLPTDPLFMPDTLFSGPDFAPPTEEHRSRIFGPVGL